MKKNPHITSHLVQDPAQRKALVSPVRLEILGQFVGRTPLTVADLAARMGRPATAVYYHVHRLAAVGLLVQAGKRPGPKRDEILYLPVADEIDLTPAAGDRDQIADAVATLATAHRMTEGDLKAALAGGRARYEGAGRNLLAFRLHARVSDERRARVNVLLDELKAIFQAGPDAPEEAEGDFCSLTVALAPLRGRNQKDES